MSFPFFNNVSSKNTTPPNALFNSPVSSIIKPFSKALRNLILFVYIIEYWRNLYLNNRLRLLYFVNELFSHIFGRDEDR